MHFLHFHLLWALGLRNLVPHYDYALDLILDTETEEVLNEEQQEVIEAAAEVLYGLIHARYIVTTRGLATMVGLKCFFHFCVLISFSLKNTRMSTLAAALALLAMFVSLLVFFPF